MKESKPDMRGKQAIAKMFGVSMRRIEQLTAEGVITGQGRPIKYDLEATVQAYIKHLSDKASAKSRSQKDEENESAKLEGEARIKQAKDEVEELKLKELKGELHRAEDVEAITADHVMYLRSMLMALPGKLAVDCAALSDAPQVADRIKREVYQVLNNLADYKYDAEAYKKRVREREGLNGQREEDE